MTEISLADHCGNPADPCMNDENWKVCASLLNSGCKNIAVKESCPLQFSCEEIVSYSIAGYDVCGDPTWVCWNEEVWNDCKGLVDSGCTDILSTKSCPVEFICLPNNDDSVRITDICGSPIDSCMNEENWNVCNSLIENGCNNVLVMESCPLQFSCGNTSYVDIDQSSVDDTGHSNVVSPNGVNDEGNRASNSSTLLVIILVVGGSLLVVTILSLSYYVRKSRKK